MAFSRKVAEDLLVACNRSCCICHKFCGSRMQIHHIIPKSKGGEDTFENAIALCLDCHADVVSYNDKHPIGRKYSPSELRKHKRKWLNICATKTIQMDTKEASEVSEISCIPEKEFFTNSEKNLNCLVVISSQSESMDLVTASMLAAKIEVLSCITEDISLPNKVYSANLENVPIGKSTIITPKILNSLWFFDDWNNAGYGNANNRFDTWETHEEIQVQFNITQNTKSEENCPSKLIFKGTHKIEQTNTAGLIYRVDNIRVPPQLNIKCNVYNQLRSSEFTIPHPAILRSRALPQFVFLKDLYTSVSAGKILDINIRTGKEGNLASQPFLICGESNLVEHQTIYRDQSYEVGNYGIFLKDIDIETKKISLDVVDNENITHSIWLSYSFENDLSKIQPDEESVFLSNAILFQTHEGYRDENDDYSYLFSIPFFIIQALDVFCGVSGNIEAMINAYVLKNFRMFYSSYCPPFILEPNFYGILVDMLPHSESFSFWESHLGIELDINQNLERIPKEFDNETDLYEINIVLLDTCRIEKGFQGPINLFKININDFSPQKNTVDFTVIQEIEGGTYVKVEPPPFEATEIVKLDEEIGDNEKREYNMILIGTPESNIIIKCLVKSEAIPDDGSSKNWMELPRANCKFYKNPFGTKKDILVISGGSRRDRKKIATELIKQLHY